MQQSWQQQSAEHCADYGTTNNNGKPAVPNHHGPDPDLLRLGWHQPAHVGVGGKCLEPNLRIRQLWQPGCVDRSSRYLFHADLSQYTNNPWYGSSVNYDVAGNQKLLPSRTFTYDKENRLVASTQPNMPAISYSLWWSAATLELRTRNLDSHNPLTLADRVAPENVHLDKRPYRTSEISPNASD